MIPTVSPEGQRARRADSEGKRYRGVCTPGIPSGALNREIVERGKQHSQREQGDQRRSIFVDDAQNSYAFPQAK